jgi:dihydrolipoamide dehydrogenase
MVADIVAGKNRAWDRVCIPAICFTDPEVVVVGLTPETARAANIEIVSDTFPFRANGRALTLTSDAGFIRMVARADNHLLLGIQGVGAGISELSAAFSLAIEMGARLEDVAGTIFAHPTLSEGILEAALRTMGRSIHI